LFGFFQNTANYLFGKYFLENFGAFDFEDKDAGSAQRHVEVCPLYAISQLDNLLKHTF
jgi:hypothetical protein